MFVLCLLDVVDSGELADGGLGRVVGAVVHSDLAILDLVLDFLVLVLGEGLPTRLPRYQTERC